VTGRKVPNPAKSKNIFVRGEKVDDFLSIKQNYLWTINLSATQELNIHLQAEGARNDELHVRLQALEARIEALK
jgi:hypothetical protein